MVLFDLHIFSYQVGLLHSYFRAESYAHAAHAKSTEDTGRKRLDYWVFGRAEGHDAGPALVYLEGCARDDDVS